MGLDMYLRLKEHSKCSVKGFGGDGDTYHRDPNNWVCVTKEYAVADWRKANHIHHWFVQKVQDGNDDCGQYNVKPEHLHELRADCMFALDAYNEGDHKTCHETMPTASGFFFGSTDYDSYYADDLRKTIKVCTSLIHHLESNNSVWDEVYYQSSW